jgi:hypothetical protein
MLVSPKLIKVLLLSCQSQGSLLFADHTRQGGTGESISAGFGSGVVYGTDDDDHYTVHRAERVKKGVRVDPKMASTIQQRYEYINIVRRLPSVRPSLASQPWAFPRPLRVPDGNISYLDCWGR